MSATNAVNICFSATGTPPIKPKVYNNGYDIFYEEWNNLHLYTQNLSYSTMFYANGERKKKNVTGYGNILIFDIDKGYTGQELVRVTNGFKRLIVTTLSHTTEKPRMRLILPLSTSLPYIKEELYKQVMRTTAITIGLDMERIDTSCLSTDRQYAPNAKQQHFYFEGEVINTDELLTYAKEDLQPKTPPPQRVFSPVSSHSTTSLKEMRAFIKQYHTFELMATLLESKGLTVKRDGAVVIPHSKTQALSIDRKTGILADFAKDEFYDVVSVHVDYYKDMTLADATKHYYSILGGK